MLFDKLRCHSYGSPDAFAFTMVEKLMDQHEVAAYLDQFSCAMKHWIKLREVTVNDSLASIWGFLNTVTWSLS